MTTQTDFNIFTLGLPVETFRVEAYIAMEERLPVVTEFALRLLRICEQVPMTVFRDYFGFTDAESLSVVDSLSRQGLLEIVDDSLQLTKFSNERFDETSDDRPRFSKVALVNDTVVFDLISFTPVRTLTRNDMVQENIIRLEASEEAMGNSEERARSAYRQHYPAIASMREDLREKSHGVYSVEDVESKRRMYIPVTVQLALNKEGQVVRKLDEAFERIAPPNLLRFMHEQITATVPKYFNTGISGLLEFIETFQLEEMRPFLQDGAFDLEGYKAATQNADRAAADGIRPMFGNLYLPENVAQITAELKRLRTPKRPGGVLATSLAWVAPDYPLWGRGDAYADAVADISVELRSGRLDSLHVFGKSSAVPEVELLKQLRVPHLKELHYTRVGNRAFSEFEQRLELMLYPTGFMVAMYHLSLRGEPGMWIPMGFMSRNPKHLEAAHRLLLSGVSGSRYGGKARLAGHKPPARPVPFEENCSFLNYCSLK